MSEKIYRYIGVDTAMELLRPGAKYTMYNTTITEWNDPRPKPEWSEVVDTIEKIKKFEDSINTIYLQEE